MEMTLPDLEQEMFRILDGADRQGLAIRLIGGVAVKLHCPTAAHRALARDYPDIDLVADRRSASRLPDLFVAFGYTPNKTFNTLNGDRRQLYFDEGHGRQVDIFVGDFEMAHRIPMNDRLSIDVRTVPLAELFLSKAQIVEMNRKDLLDLVALLIDHPVGHGDTETINLDVIAHLCAQDWGLCTTVGITGDRVRRFLETEPLELADGMRQTVESGLETIARGVEAAPKSLAWKMRARVGTRVRWYQEVEEVRR